MRLGLLPQPLPIIGRNQVLDVRGRWMLYVPRLSRGLTTTMGWMLCVQCPPRCLTTTALASAGFRIP